MPDLLIRSLTASKSLWSTIWGKFGVALAALAATWLFGIMGFAWTRAVAIYKIPEVMIVYEQLPAQIQDLRKDNQTILKKLERQEYRANTFVGIAKVGDFDGEATAQVNTIGEARDYDGLEKMRVTNLSAPDSPSLLIKIEGNFRNENAAYLIRLSRSAASKLDVKGSAKVRIEPAEQQK